MKFHASLFVGETFLLDARHHIIQAARRAKICGLIFIRLTGFLKVKRRLRFDRLIL
jgi:hypothetical protein